MQDTTSQALEVTAGLSELTASIGGTPLVELTRGADLAVGVRLFAKLESVEPGGSIKDRSVLSIYSGAIERGDLVPGGSRRLLDSSSGNAGIAYAWIGAALGIPVTLVVPANASRERLARIRAHGAELILTDPVEGYDFAVLEARRIARQDPQRFWYADQYGNADNVLAHERGTAAEILQQLARAGSGPPDAFVHGVGTGGTLTGIARALRQRAGSLHVRAVKPELFPGIEGLKPLGDPEDLVPEILEIEAIDSRRETSLDEAIEACRLLAQRGLFVGPSSGANYVAARELARTGSYKCVVTLFCDTGERYVSTGMWGS